MNNDPYKGTRVPVAESVEWWQKGECLCHFNPANGYRLDIVCPQHDKEALTAQSVVEEKP